MARFIAWSRPMVHAETKEADIAPVYSYIRLMFFRFLRFSYLYARAHVSDRENKTQNRYKNKEEEIS